MTDKVRESIDREMEGNIHALGARGSREVKVNALIIQYSAQYRGTAEFQRQHTFVFHLKQVDIADDASPTPFAGARVRYHNLAKSATARSIDFDQCRLFRDTQFARG